MLCDGLNVCKHQTQDGKEVEFCGRLQHEDIYLVLVLLHRTSQGLSSTHVFQPFRPQATSRSRFLPRSIHSLHIGDIDSNKNLAVFSLSSPEVYQHSSSFLLRFSRKSMERRTHYPRTLEPSHFPHFSSSLFYIFAVSFRILSGQNI